MVKALLIVVLLPVEWQFGEVADRSEVICFFLSTKRLKTLISYEDYFEVSLGLLKTVNSKRVKLIAPILLALSTALNFFFGILCWVSPVVDWPEFAAYVTRPSCRKPESLLNLGKLFSRWGSLLLQTSSVGHRGHADGD